jgi:hypothetical protein
MLIESNGVLYYYRAERHWLTAIPGDQETKFKLNKSINETGLPNLLGNSSINI